MSAAPDTRTIPRPRQLTFLQLLLSRGDITIAAELAGETRATGHALADAHGWPDRSRVKAAVADMDAAGIIGHRTPVHPGLAQRRPDAVRGPAAGPARGTPRPPGEVTPPAAAAPPRAPGGLAGAGGQQLVDLPVTAVHPDPGNPREHLDGIDDLAASMASVGLLQPLVVRVTPDGYVVVAGHRRLAAALRLGWIRVSCIVRRDLRPDDVLLAMLVENNQRKDLDPIEEARALRRLAAERRLGSHAQIAAAIGRNQVWVSGRLALLDLDAGQQEQLRAGQMSVVEAQYRARVASGRVKPGAQGRDSGWHLGPGHRLAGRAKARCQHLGHRRGRTVGGMACGECWESVLRADERQHLHEASARAGECALCSGPYAAPAAAEAGT